MVEKIRFLLQYCIGNLESVNLPNFESQVTHIQEKNRKDLSKNLYPIKHTFHTIKSDNFEDALEQFIREQKGQLMVMVAKNQNYLQRIFLKPNIQQTSYHLQIPFIILHP